MSRKPSNNRLLRLIQRLRRENPAGAASLAWNHGIVVFS